MLITAKINQIRLSTVLNLPDHVKRLLENPETGGFRELFLPQNDFKTCSAINFQKQHPDFEGLESNQGHEIQTRTFFHMHFYR